uniref:ATP binding cassette subfamily C member 6 n=1 Tax=Vombatus ursinus TaxID=29139 RepID=A0A4X2LR57_VOMUR
MQNKCEITFFFWRGRTLAAHSLAHFCFQSLFCCAYLSFLFLSSIIILGYKKPLEREDLFELNDSDSSYNVCPIFEKQWRKNILTNKKKQKVKLIKSKAKKPSLLHALWNTFNFSLIQVALFKVFADILAFISPLIMKQMILFCENHHDLVWNGYGYAVVLFIVVILQTLVLQLYQRFNMLNSAKIKTAVIGLLYKKALNLSNSSRKKFSTGEIINLFSRDAQQLMDLTVNLNILWSAPLQILMAIVLLWQELGPSVLAGVAVLVLVIPINALVANRLKIQTKNKDQQIKLLNEVLQGIKILKLYAWEPSYQKKITEIRKHELEIQKSGGYLTVFSMLTLTCIPFLVSLATFGVYFLLDEGNILTANKVFTFMSLFNILRLPLFDLPTVISAVVQVLLHNFEINYFYNFPLFLLLLLDYAIEFTDASFTWEKSQPPTLNDLNIKIPEGALVAIIGQVGSGKSSVLSAILGEMEKLKGTVQRKGSVAYVSQQAWIQNSKLQENIVFGSVLQKQYYERVLEACALLPDLEQFPNGDQTEIGERGVNISGGQKQRVSLARAVYSGADIYLLDDPLSAVDVHVGKHLFEKVIGSSGLLKNKTRVLVTHNLTILPQTDLILVIESGKVAQMGTYQELLSKSKDFINLLQISSAQEKGKDIMKSYHIVPSICLFFQSINQKFCVYVKFSSIVKYLQAFGWLWMWLCVATYLGQNLVSIGQNLWLSTWTKEAKQVKDTMEWKQLRNHKLNVYGLLGLIQGRNMWEWFTFSLISPAIICLNKKYYIASSRQIRRLAGASRSPIISHFGETLSGVSTIRAFGHQQRFISQNRDLINENLVCFYNNIISNRWLSVRLKFLGDILVFFAALLAVLAGDAMDSTTVGLIISYALNITQSLNFWVRKTCEIETNAISIERVFEYTNIKKEAPWIKSNRPPSHWPDKGIVEFVNYEARYRPDLGLALQNVTFQTHSEEKIGIVGRTGAGKSTLTNCLFRIVEKSGGKIIIDGIDISTIGLHDLRGKLNIIPQDPVLFSGTLQMNLDPLENCSDNELWEALELCHLKDFVQSLPKRLLHEISEGGENLSAGQRQLVCLARALLRKTKILVLDEPTASVDYETDNLVQTTIQKEFADCTILTIAHRLHTVMDSERILVLDSGRIIEFETPQNLIRQKGLFSEMVKEAGII